MPNERPPRPTSEARRRAPNRRRAIGALSLALAGIAALPAAVPHSVARAQRVSPPTGTVAGIVTDSTRRVPLAGATVFVFGTDHRGLTDADGRFEVAGVPAGTYPVVFTHPRLDQLGVASRSRKVTVRPGETSRLDLAVPSVATIWSAGCRALAGGERGAIGGVVRDSATGAPFPGARLVLSWDPAPSVGEGGEAMAETDMEGRYFFCGVPAGVPVRLLARFAGHVSPTRTLRVDRGAAVNHDVDFAVRALSRVSGRVVAVESGLGVSGAAVRFVGTSFETLTDRQGRFDFVEVPPGVYPLEVEHLSYGGRIDSLAVPGGRIVRIEARISGQAIPLEPLTVTAEERPREVVGRGTGADVLTLEEIEKLIRKFSPRHVGDLLQRARFARLNIRPVTLDWRSGGPDLPSPDGLCIEATRSRAHTFARRCNMVEVYLDEVRLADPIARLRDLDPAGIRRIEFLSGLEAGARFGTGSSKGVLLIWTRRGTAR